jgi:hypothetical protein
MQSAAFVRFARYTGPAGAFAAGLYLAPCRIASPGRDRGDRRDPAGRRAPRLHDRAAGYGALHERQ